MRKSLLGVIILVGAALLLVPVSAHEGREAGPYQIVFGWRVEPAYTDLLNGPEFTIQMHSGEEGEEEAEGEHSDTGVEDHHDAGAMVEGAEDTLQLEVSFGDQTKQLRIRPVFGEPGNYTADLIPTRPGDYTFRLFGTIGETEIDETFSSADGEFSTVEPISDIRFP